MMDRREFLASAAATLALTRPLFAGKAGANSLASKERVDRALRGQDVDRPPFTFYHHYKGSSAKSEAQNLVEFHRIYKTDIVKVMNDFKYPHSTTGKWYELKALDSPFPDQLATLRLVRDELKGDAYFIDTIYGPYMTAMILFQSQPQFAHIKQSEEVATEQIKSLHEFQQDNPDAWHSAMEAITQSTINHIQRAKEIGTSGALVSVFNAESRFGSVEDYQRYTRPYDKRVFDALADTRLSTLHLHYLERPYLDQFKDFNAPVVQYSAKVSGIPISEFRKHFSQTILGGVDEIDYRKLTVAEMRKEWMDASKAAGSRYIAAPGCSIPDNSTHEELARFPRSLGVDIAASQVSPA